MPITVTCDRPSPRVLLSPTPRSTSTLMPSAAAVSSTAARSFFQSRGAETSTPRTRRRRSTICSMSRTSTPAVARVEKIDEVTPGRSLPVSVIRRVFGASSRCASSMSGTRLSPSGDDVGGGSYADPHGTHTSRDRLHRAHGVRPRPRPRRSTSSAFGWTFNDYGPDYAGIRSPDGEGEVGGLNPARSPEPGGPSRAALLRRPRRHRERGGVGRWRCHRGPLRVPGREEVPLHRPQRQRAGRLGLRVAVTPGARPRGSTPRPGRVGRRARAGPAPRVAARSPTAVTAPPSSARARSTMVMAWSPRPARSRHRPGHALGRHGRSRVAQVHELVRDFRAPLRHLEAARVTSAVSSRAERSARSASPTSGSWRRSAGCAHHVTAAPTRTGTSPSGAPTATAASPASSAAALKAPGPPSPSRSPSVGRARPIPVPPAARIRPRPSASGSVPSGPAIDVSGVVGEHGVDHLVGHDMAAQPRRTPPCEAGGCG